MKLRNTFLILGKDLLMGPRGGLFLWVVVTPLVMTFLIKIVFGGLIDPSPRLGIVDYGSSQVAAEARDLKGIEVTMLDSEENLKSMVEANDLDAGIVLSKTFDRELLSGEKPVLNLFIGGESLASNRIVLSVTALDLIRSVEGKAPPVEVAVETLGDDPGVPIADRLVPLMILMAVALGGIFLPASAIVQERELKTLDAVIVTPVTVDDFIAAKGILGFILAFVVGAVTMLINGGFTAYIGGNLLILAVASLMCVQFGILLGSGARDMTTLFTVFKGGGIILFAPAILFLFPGVPQWIAKIFPTYYFLGPLYDLTLQGVALKEILLDLGIGVIISLALMILARILSRKMAQKLGT